MSQTGDHHSFHRLSAWRNGPVTVISELAYCKLPREGAGMGLQFLVSISANGKRPKPHHVRKALRAFGMVGAEQDNHHPGVARHYWLPVDPEQRVTCQCKESEDVLDDGQRGDSYPWTNPNDGGDCRGCEFERLTGKPCPVHAATEAVG